MARPAKTKNKTKMPKTATKKSAKSAKPARLSWFNSSKYAKPFLFALVFAVVGAVVVLVSFAAVPEGRIVNSRSGKCLENFFNRQINGNFVSIYPCNADNQAQQWVMASDSSIRTKQNFCLDIPNASRRAKTQVQLWQCTGGAGQRWKVRDNGTIRNPNAGLCLEAGSTNTALGGPNIFINTCNATNKRQVWTVPKSSVPVPVPTPPPTNPSPTPSPTSGWKSLSPKTSWQWQLTGTVNETVLDGVSGPKMYDIDMFNASAALISRLKAKGIYVVCYVESGDWAKGRPDAGDYAPAILGRAIGGFPDEKFVNVNALDGPVGPTGKTLRQIMAARLDLAKSKGCDGIEPDLDDLHTYSTGFSISMDQMVAYNKAIIDMGHARGMSVGLKNGASGGTFEKKMLSAGADWALNEECNQYSECSGYSQFIAAGKPVFQVEYLDNQRKPYSGASGTCAKNNAANFDGIVKDSSSKLSALPRIACR
jgi:hypothetical protein